ncbi:MAG: hypothetical protein QXL01_03185 [Thermoplasmatales archaeon]
MIQLLKPEIIKYGSMVLAVLGLAIFSFSAGSTWTERKYKLEIAEIQKAAAEEVARIRAEVLATNMALQQTIIKNQEISNARLKALEVPMARVASTTRGLQDSIARVTDRANLDTLAACHNTAETLGLLLRTANERADRDAGDLELLNEEKRLLIESWNQMKKEIDDFNAKRYSGSS